MNRLGEQGSEQQVIDHLQQLSTGQPFLNSKNKVEGISEQGP